VGELVRDDGLQLLARQPGQGALRHADHAAAVEVAEGEGVEPDGADDHALDARRPGGDAHLLDDVGEALVVAVAGVERPAVQGAEEPLARADPGEAPVDEREDERRSQHREHTRGAEKPRQAAHERDRQTEDTEHDEAGDPERDEREREQQREQRPDAPALLALDLEQGATERGVHLPVGHRLLPVTLSLTGGRHPASHYLTLQTWFQLS